MSDLCFWYATTATFVSGGLLLSHAIFNASFTTKDKVVALSLSAASFLATAAVWYIENGGGQ
ncbi:MAG: hypothetical protein IMZ46_01605 [Acidobacteria bacterium]|nr:hypothetical protein [Acidobacteriota bacterium]